MMNSNVEHSTQFSNVKRQACACAELRRHPNKSSNVKSRTVVRDQLQRLANAGGRKSKIFKTIRAWKEGSLEESFVQPDLVIGRTIYPKQHPKRQSDVKRIMGVPETWTFEGLKKDQYGVKDCVFRSVVGLQTTGRSVMEVKLYSIKYYDENCAILKSEIISSELAPENGVLSEEEKKEQVKVTDDLLSRALEFTKTLMKSEAMWILGRKPIFYLEQIVFLIRNLIKYSDIDDCIWAAAQFISAVTGGIVHSCLDFVNTMCKAKSPGESGAPVKRRVQLEPQSFGSVRTLFTMLMSDDLAYVIGTAYAVFNCHIASISFDKMIFGGIIKYANAETLDAADFIDRAIKLFEWWATVGMACFRAKSLSPILHGTKQLSYYQAKYYEYLQYYNDKMRNASVENFTVQERRDLFENVTDAISGLLMIVKTNHKATNSVAALGLMNEFHALREKVLDVVRSVDWVPAAMGFHMFGPPCAGKTYDHSEVLRTAVTARAAALDDNTLSFDPQRLNHLNTTTGWQNGLNNLTQTILGDDICPTASSGHDEKRKEFYSTVLGLITNRPFAVPRADVENKDRVFIAPEAVFLTSNPSDPFADVAAELDAFNRRYLSIEKHVAPVALTPSGTLDQDALASGRVDEDDAFLYSIYRKFKPPGAVRQSKLYFKFKEGDTDIESKNMKYSTFLKAIYHITYQDIESQIKARKFSVEKRAAGKDCDKCKMPTRSCMCNNFQKTGQSVETIQTSELNREVRTVEISASALAPAPCDRRPGSIEAAIARNASQVPLLAARLRSRSEPTGNDRVTRSSSGNSNNNNRGDRFLINKIKYTKPKNGNKPDPQSGIVDDFIYPICVNVVRSWIAPFTSLAEWARVSRAIGDSSYEELVDEINSYGDRIAKYGLGLIPKKLLYFDKDGVLDYNSPTILGKLTERYIKWQGLSNRFYCSGGTILRRSLVRAGCVVVIGYGIDALIGTLVGKKWRHFSPAANLESRFSSSIMAVSATYTTCFVAAASIDLAHRELGAEQRVQGIISAVREQPDLVEHVIDFGREDDKTLKSFFIGAGAAAVLIKGLSLFNQYRKEHNTAAQHGEVDEGDDPEPQGEEDSANSDPPEQKRGSYFDFMRLPTFSVPTPSTFRNHSATEAINAIKKNMVVVSDCGFSHSGASIVLGVYLETKYLLLPAHFVDEVCEKNGGQAKLHITSGATRHTVHLDREARVEAPSGDLALVYVPKGPAIKRTLYDFLPTEPLRKSARALLLTTDRNSHDAEWITSELTVRAEGSIPVLHRKIEHSLTYSTNLTGKGSCMSVLLANRRNPAILGFHVAGDRCRPDAGYAQFCSRHDAEQLVARMRREDCGVTKVAHSALAINEYPDCIFEMEPGPHPKAQPFQDKVENVTVLGHITKLDKPRVKARNSLIYEVVRDKVSYPAMVPDFSKPYQIYNPKLETLSKGCGTFPYKARQYAYRSYFKPLIERAAEWVNTRGAMEPLNMVMTINGDKTRSYITPVNRKTSTTHPRFKDKLGMLDFDEETNLYHLKEEYQRVFDSMCKDMEGGKVLTAIVRAHLKSEVVQKVGKARVFYAMEFLVSLLVRKYYLPIIHFLLENRDLSECAVGMNPAGRDWDEMFKNLANRTVRNYVDLDFKGYDLARCPQTTIATGNGYIEVACALGYSEEDCAMMEIINAMLLNPVVVWNGTVFSIFMFPSGHPLTVIWNSGDNSQLMRCAFYLIAKQRGLEEIPEFSDEVSLRTYGDDNFSTCKRAELWGFKQIQAQFAAIGMTVTDASKSDNPPDYISEDQVEFLKRANHNHPILGYCVGKLSLSSIWKSLLMHTGKGELEDLFQDVLYCALRELCLHEREVYEENRSILRDACEEVGVFNDWLNKTYEEMCEDVRTCMEFSIELEMDELSDSDSEEEVTIVQESGTLVLENDTKSLPQKLPDRIEAKPKIVKRITRRGASALCFLTAAIIGMCVTALMIYARLSVEQNRHTNGNNMKTVSFGSTASRDSQQQNILMKDNAVATTDSRGAVMDSTRDDGFVRDVPLNEFFSRPVQIAEYDWSPGVQFHQRINPWTLFWGNARVKEKLHNYYLLKTTMKVKILINGNPFYFGMLMAAYEPLAPIDPNGTPDPWNLYDFIRGSQRIKGFVDPTSSSGCELELPFFWYNNALRIPNADWNNMGELVLSSLNTLQHVNGGTDSVRITVLAWAENVSVSIPTQILPESGEVDEYGKGVVSKKASTVARIGRQLKDIPVIGPYARATEIGASSVAAMAKLFGYSKTMDLKESTYNPISKRSLATTDSEYDGHKLTYDSKQEITLDPRTTGLEGYDELNIASIAQRESYLSTFTWTPGAAGSQSGSILWSMLIDPGLHTQANGALYLPACAFATLPFQSWRGSMRVRFQIVCSAYHRGRLRLVYDPSHASTTAEYNTNYSTIHDVAEEKDFCVDIGWTRNVPYIRAIRPYALASSMYGNTAIGIPSDAGNGVLSVYVQNDLTTPSSSTQPVEINVYISALDDFEVAPEPNGDMYNLHIRPESGNMECEEVPAVNDPEVVDSIADTGVDDPMISKVFYGESVQSFRQLLKRECYHEAIISSSSPFGAGSRDVYKFSYVRPAFPQYGGAVFGTLAPNTNVITSGSGNYLYAKTTLLNFVAAAFLGWRGSIRWTWDTSMASPDDDGTICVTRLNNGRASNILSLFNSGVDANNHEVALTTSNSGHFGSAIRSKAVNPQLSFEIPFLKNVRFQPIFNNFNNSSSTTSVEPHYEVEIMYRRPEFTTRNVLQTYCSTGEDFNLFFFNGCPPLYGYDPYTGP